MASVDRTVRDDMTWQTLSFHFKQTFDGGYRFLDKCGEFMLAAGDKMNFVPGEAKPTGGKLEIPEKGVSVTFNAIEMSASQEFASDNGDFFVSLCSGLVALVSDYFKPRSILSNGFALKSYWPSHTADDLLSASLTLGGNFQVDLGKVLGMAPKSKKLDYFFASGSTDFHVVVEPVTFERVNLPRKNANFRANRLERGRVDRYNRFATHVNTDLEHAILMTRDIIENDPPDATPLKPLFGELRRQNEVLRKLLTLK